MEIERRLSNVLSEFARTLVTDFPIQAILDHLVVRIVYVLPVGAAGVTLITPDHEPHYIAASDDAALRYERLQSELGEGPCLEAFRSGEAVEVPDLRLEHRFPEFTERALGAGLMAVFTFPLRHGEDQLGALDLYRTTAGPLDAVAMAAAQTLADVTAAYLLNAQARSDLRESSERAHQTSLHDGLTGLPNRTLLVQRLEHAILRCRRSHKMVAILFADLDRFKSINDTYGHHVGDELLVAVSKRLSGVLRPEDTLARLAGDEFAILCEDLGDASEVEPIAGRIDAALDQPFVLSGVELRVTASVGIAFAGNGDDLPEQVLQDADVAMYEAKRNGGANHTNFDLREYQLTNHRASLSRDLRGALIRDELGVEYQPIVSIADERIIGMEGLLRWTHPRSGIVPAGTTVPIAEQCGLMTEIGLWVLERACVDLRAWQTSGAREDLGVSINVWNQQLVAPGFAEQVEAVLASTDTNPTNLTLDLTERSFVEDPERALVVLADLKAVGVTLALDDFGTGHSSLAHLAEFPVDAVKLHGAMVAEIGRDLASRLMAIAVVGMAHGLRIDVVAEGVETPEQHLEVITLGCDAYQGFHFARPRSAADVDVLLAGQGPILVPDVLGLSADTHFRP